MFWKVYTAVFCVLNVLGFMAYAAHPESHSLIEWIAEVIFVPIGIVGLVNYVFRRSWMTTSQWKPIFLVYIVGMSIELFFGLSRAAAVNGMTAPVLSAVMVLTLSLTIPAGYALYRNSYPLNRHPAA